MQLLIQHDTHYHYAAPVAMAQHVAHLQPPDSATQRCLSHRLQVQPAPPQLQQRRDGFGNHRAYWALNQPHRSLLVSAHSRVDTRCLPAPQSHMAWEASRAHLSYQSGRPGDLASAFVFASPHVPQDPAFAAYASASFLPGRPLIEAARDLMGRIHREFRYDPDSTDIGTPALQVLASRHGVCQDFAHVLLGCLRSLGMAGRYVSGYLLTNPPPGQPRAIGADASHAWASVYLPDLAGAAHPAWYDLDPTNNRSGWCSPGEDYVLLASGRDFSDVSPLRGVLQGGAEHQLAVAVTVRPIDDLS